MFNLPPWMWAIIGLITICIVYIILRQTLKQILKTEKSKAILLAVLNWSTLFILITYALNYFSESRWLFDPFFTSGSFSVSIFLVAVAIFIVALASRISVLSKTYILPSIYDKYNLEKGIRFTFNSVFHYTLLLIAILAALSTLGIRLSSLTVFASVLGVGIGFGMQNIASNFISGLIILFERPIKVGDRVIVDNIIGDVDEINMRATIVKTLDNEHIIIPNSFFLEEKVINRSYSDTRLRLVIPVGVAYESDVEHVEQLLLEAVRDISETWTTILKSPKPSVHFVSFGDSSLDFKLFVWIDNPIHEFQIKSALHFMVLKKFRQHHIEIPFPQRDIHMRP